MKSADDIERYFQKSTLSTNSRRHEAVFEKIQRAQDQSKDTAPVLSGPKIRNKIMKSPTIKLATAAVVIAAIALGLLEFIDGGGTSGVVWAEVVTKVEASRGVILRRTMTSSMMPGEVDYRMIYSCPTHARTDQYEADRITSSLYRDYNARTSVRIEHDNRRYFRNTMSEQTAQDHQNEIDPKAWVRKFLSCECRNLGQKTIDGILCEGLETSDPAFLDDSDPPVESLMLQLWVSVETRYPVLFECNAVNRPQDGGRIEVVMDQFQWNVELDASEFDPKIPQDYELMQ